MRLQWMSIATVACIALTMQIAPGRTHGDNVDGPRQYTIGVDGTHGVKLRMLLVTKPSANRPPTRQSKVITIPFEATFRARAFYVWFDTLPGGASGKDGDRIMGDYTIDGERQGGGFGGTIKQSNHKTFSFGDL